MEIVDVDSATLKAVGFLAVRLIAGTLFIFQAYDRIFKVGLPEVAKTFCAACGNNHLFTRLAYPAVFINAWLELLAGILLVCGLLVGLASSALCLNLVMVTIVFSWAKPIWDETHVFVRLALLLSMLLLPPSWDQFALDRLFQ